MIFGLVVPVRRTIRAHVGCRFHRGSKLPSGRFPDCGPVGTFTAVVWLGRPWRIRRLA